MIDLYDGTLSEGTHVSVWRGDECIYVQFGYMNFSMPEELWKDFIKIINFSEKHRNLLEMGKFEEIPTLKREINAFNSEIKKALWIKGRGKIHF